MYLYIYIYIYIIYIYAHVYMSILSVTWIILLWINKYWGYGNSGANINNGTKKTENSNPLLKKAVLTDTQYVNAAQCEFIFLDVTFNYG